MAGITWKRIAEEKGLTFQDRSIFGWYNGCHITLGSMWDIMYLHVYIPAQPESQDPAVQEEQQRNNVLLRAEAVRALEESLKEFNFRRVRSFSGEQTASVEFRGGIKAMKSLDKFIDSATAKVAALGITYDRTCSICHSTLENGEVPVKIKGNVFPMHDACADAMVQDAAWGNVPKRGSVLLGLLGATLAAVVGAIPWAVVLVLGYMASVVGLLIGYLINKGYDLLHGRQGRATIAVVLLFVLLSVALGQIAGTSYEVSKYYDEVKAELKPYEEMIYTKAEAIFYFWTEDLWVSPDAIRETFSNLGLGAFFALLGCFSMFRKITRDTTPLKPKRMTITL